MVLLSEHFCRTTCANRESSSVRRQENSRLYAHFESPPEDRGLSVSKLMRPQNCNASESDAKNDQMNIVVLSDALQWKW